MILILQKLYIVKCLNGLSVQDFDLYGQNSFQHGYLKHFFPCNVETAGDRLLKPFTFEIPPCYMYESVFFELCQKFSIDSLGSCNVLFSEKYQLVSFQINF